MVDTIKYLSGGRIQGASTDAIGAVDTLGTAVNGSNSGCVTEGNTPFYGDTSVTFDDNDAAHLFGSTSSFAGLVKEDFTVTFWAKCSGRGNMEWGAGSNPGNSPYARNQGCVLCLGQISGGGNGFVISFDDNNTNQFFVCGGDGSNVFLNDTQNDGADHDNNYHLYMFHFDNTNEELRVYRDGSATPRDTTSYERQITSTAATTYDEMYMGRQNIDDVRYFIGQLADVSIWKRLLTTGEFTQLWDTFADDTATATSSVHGARVSALTNQAGLLAHWKLDDLNFTNSATKTDKSKTTITNVPVGTRYEETDTKKIFRMATDLVSGTGLRAYYNCDSATTDNNATLVAGNNTLGTAANATNSNVTLDTTDEKLGTGCLDFNGTNAYLSIPAQANLIEGLTEWSISFWVWADDWSAVTDRQIMSQWDTSGSDGAVFRVEPQTDRTIKVRIRRDDNQATMYNGENACGGNGTWNHVVFNFYEDSGQKGQMYINGSVDSGGVVSFPNDMRANGDDTALEIGDQTNQANSEFSGKLDEISFWSRKLTTAEITLLYNSGAGMNLASGTQSWKQKGTA